MSGWFVTGTDTDCGKTTISLGVMAALQASGLSVVGMKPVASGCVLTPDGLRNADAQRLLAQSSREQPYDLVNLYAFAPPIAPHLAAREAGVVIDLMRIATTYHTLRKAADHIVVEGVGGWRAPLAPDLFVSDIPLVLGLPVILVVGLKLGCLNHALLTVESIRASGHRLAGWVANQVDPDMPVRDGNLATLDDLIPAPCLGVVPRLDSPTAAECAAYLHLDTVLNPHR